MIKSHMPSFLWPTRYGCTPPPQSFTIASASVATSHLRVAQTVSLRNRQIPIIEFPQLRKPQTNSLRYDSLPKEQKQKQRDPQSVHEMPIDSRRLSRAEALQFTLDGIAFPRGAQYQVTERENAAEQVQSMRGRE